MENKTTLTFFEARNAFYSGDFNPEEILDTLLEYYAQGLKFWNKLHGDTEDLNLISEDMMKIGFYIQTVGSAKSLAEALYEYMMSTTDDNWRKKDLADWKLSAKSSTNHQINLKGKISTYSLISKEMTSLYFNFNTRFDSLKFASANLKFLIDKELIDYRIKKTIHPKST